MATLRRACRSCTTSKRKCIVQSPKCARCAERGLECTYDLEHVNAPTEQVSANPTSFDCPGYCIIETLKTLAPDIDPAISIPGKDDNLEFIRLGYRSVPETVKAGKPAVFIHPKLQISDNYNHLVVFQEGGQAAISDVNFQRLIQTDIQAVPVLEALTALQALLLYLAAFLFPGEAEQANAEQYLSLLSNWTQNILISAQTRMPRNPSLWQEWLFGESVRRTILMSYGLSMTLHNYKYGYCTEWLFLESLPFDNRVGVWMAESPQAWIAAAQVRTGEEVGQQLSSFHEFGESLGETDHNFSGDVFLALVAYGHNGVKRNQESIAGRS